MSAKIIDGKAVATRIKGQISEEIVNLKNKGVIPCLAVVIVGNDQASRGYVNSKKKACEEVGMKSVEYALPEETSQDDLVKLIFKLNKDPEVHGILVQLPLPAHISEKSVINLIDSKKDVDCFHPFNVGCLVTGSPVFEPCTPAGIIELIKESGIEIRGKNCVVIGRSNIVGKPIALMLLALDATVTIAHSKTQDLRTICKTADILIAAIGKAKYITDEYIKSGAIVIDVGMDRDENGKRCGDVDFEKVSKIAGAITPVPGGVGPMTITMLLKNTLKACTLRLEGW
ncbi:MAG: bifunctional methylenetetrahydrofolate dehydrogenase/methenyltetrahydrofolate cyclohydrolase FolD [Clostridiales bacterium]|jgi:methylenetetrahydrofolate dehydrogenase (NADP+)/methenyltetrahydrofolate cyclohydrolase|nr:bifunctional methylenetetrahydrofolate dehydrogenase/methenyltetrahydrofolate cyclohydrolase FolD [Clostridiales bacterium]